MAHTQPFVFRLYFNSDSDVQSAIGQLNSMGFRSDSVNSSREEPAKRKLIFVSSNLKVASDAVARLNVKPVKADYFDPAAPWNEDFKPLQ